METLKILWYNWRCIKHPLAGGAEVYTHEIARRLVRLGHEVILVTSKPKNLPSTEEIDGYEVIRIGNKYTVYIHARKVYNQLKKEGWKPDVIIDEVNTIPFLTPKYVHEPIIMLIHQLCKECWRYAIHPLVEPIGWWIERKLHNIYIYYVNKDKIKAVITVSDSTKNDLITLGYPNDKIYIIYNGLDWTKYQNCHKLAKNKEDLVIYVGRITPYKKLEDLILAWNIVEREHPSADLIIAGRPNYTYLKKLIELAKELELKRIKFKINISQKEKKSLLAKAKILVYTSIREGWGQTIVEAAACKTPAIGYDVPGLRDSIIHDETGLLIKSGNIEDLANAIITLLINNSFRKKLEKNAYNHALKLDWNKIAEKFSQLLEYYISR